MSTLISNSTEKRDRDLSKYGFSLIELSLVLAILIILVGFAMPRFSLLLESDLEKEARKMAKIISDLRVQAILHGKGYQIALDTKTSQYIILVESTDNPGTFVTDPDYPKPIRIENPVEIKSVETGQEQETRLRFAGRKIEFDKIFGQSYKFLVDSTGFVDIFSVTFRDQSDELELSVVNIMGKITIEPPQRSVI